MATKAQRWAADNLRRNANEAARRLRMGWGIRAFPWQNLAATLSGFSAYRQIPDIPDVGAVHGWNLAKNGGFTVPVAGEWTLHANASRVVDALSPSGWSLRLIATGAGQDSPQDLTIEASTVSSYAAQMRSDGTMIAKVLLRWLDAGGAQIGADVTIASATSAAQTEYSLANQTAPGNARTARIVATSTGAGTAFFSCFRVKQQAAAPAAWSSADQQTLGNKGLAIYEAATNTAGADADMETVGVANYTATTATLTKTTTNPFAGSQRLTVTNTAANGYAAKTGALAAGQAIAVSVRCIGADAGAGLKLVSTPGGTTIGTDFAASTDWAVRKVSGTIAGGDTGWEVRLVGGSGAAAVSHFDNLGVENKSYDTLNSDPAGLAYTATSRAASSDTEALDTGFDITDFGRTVAVRFDHAVSRAVGALDRWVWGYYIDVNNNIRVDIEQATGRIRLVKVRAGVPSLVDDGGATAFAAGDELSIGGRHSATVGLELRISKNGGAVATYTMASAEAKNVLSGTPTNYIGRSGLAGNELDGTIGIDRHLKAGVTAAQVTTSVQNVYAQQDEAYESVVYRFDGSAATSPYIAPATYSIDHDVGEACVSVLSRLAGSSGPRKLDVMRASGARDVIAKLAEGRGTALIDTSHATGESCVDVIRRLG